MGALSSLFRTATKSKFGKPYTPGLALVIGIGLSLVFFQVLRSVEKALVESAFSGWADIQKAALQGSIDRNLEVLDSLGALFESSSSVTRDDFRTFVASPLARHQEIQALEWIPDVRRENRDEFEKLARHDGLADFQFTEKTTDGVMVRAAPRAEYFPVYYVEPLAGNVAAVGFDLSSNPARFAALNVARDSGATIATARITLVQETGKQFGLLIYRPVYRKKSANESQQDRRDNLLGFALGVFRAGDLAEKSMKPFESSGIDIRISDANAPADEQFIYQSSSASRAPRRAAGNWDAQPNRRKLVRADELILPGRRWKLEFAAGDVFIAAHSTNRAWIVLVAGISLTLLAAFYLSARNSHLAGIAEQAFELAEKNEALTAEIRQREHAEQALRDSEERFRLAAQLATDVIYERDMRTGVAEFYGDIDAIQGFPPGGYPRDQLGFFDLLHPDDATPFIAAVEEMMAHRKAFCAEIRIRRADGGYNTWTDHSRLIFDEHDLPRKWIGVATNITERKRAEAALRESEKRFRLLVQNSNDIIQIIDENGAMTYISDSIAGILGYAPEELRGEIGFLGVHPDDLPRVTETFAAGLAEPGAVRRVEYRYRHKNGSWIDLETVGCNLLRDPAVNGIVLNIRDNTERKRAEEALRKTEETYRLHFANVSDFIFSLDRNGVFLSLSPSIEKMLGYKPEELIGKPFAELNLVAPEDLERAVANANKVIAGETIDAAEYIFVAKDGSRRFGEVTSSPIAVDGKIVAAVAVARDITERKAHEEKKTKLETQLFQAQKMETVGRLAGGVAHDFNNMLQIINSYSEICLERLGAEDASRRPMQEIYDAGQRAAGLTRQLLAFSRKQVLQPVVLDINKTIAEMEKMLRRLIGEDIHISTVHAPDLGKVRADPGQIEQVLMNLAINARDAMPDGGKLTIETANVELDERYAARHVGVAPGPYVMLAVSDTGCGMDEATKASVFEPFFTTKEKGKGTGLGLSTVYGIVKQSGGNIWVYSEPGQGATFKIYLPREASDSSTPPAKKSAAKGVPGTETILVVEDEESVRRLVAEVLTSVGYTVFVCAGGREAIARCDERQGPIDLLLTDVVMPQMSGRQLAELLAPIRPETKVLYMSGYTDNAIVHHGVLDHGTNFISKPFTVAALTHKVREVLDAR